MTRELLQRLIDAWDSSPLPKASDGMMQERMEELRAALAVPVLPQKERRDFIDGYMAGMDDGRRIAEENAGPACCGENCGSRNPRHHSAECFAEHERTISQPSAALAVGDSVSPVEPVAVPSISECEACFTPDVCQLRGKCDHYSAQVLRVTAPKVTP